MYFRGGTALLAMVIIGLSVAMAGAAPATSNFSGKWRTIKRSVAVPDSILPFILTLEQSEERIVDGTVKIGESERFPDIGGIVVGNVFKGEWYGANGGPSNPLYLTMSPDGQSFHGFTLSGTVPVNDPAKAIGIWDGFRLPDGFPLKPSPGVPTAKGTRYDHPYIELSPGTYALLDWCREWATNCGQPAADAFCAAVDGGRLPKAVDAPELKRGGRFGQTMTIGSRQICNDPACSAFDHVTCGGSASVPAPSTTPGGPCGPPGGAAVVTIADPNLTKLNVRVKPGGKVVGTIPEGQTVRIVGECGSEPAAGLAKTLGKPSGGLGKSPGQLPQPGPGTGGTPGWCQIDAPVNGCVSAQFLTFGGSGGAAGLAKQPLGKPSSGAATGFAGSWDAEADGVTYRITFAQKGSSVNGRYSGADGSAGSISGRMKGRVLRFSWKQADGQRGSGQFTLSADGQSFAGNYSLANNPNAGGAWNGTRR